MSLLQEWPQHHFTIFQLKIHPKTPPVSYPSPHPSFFFFSFRISVEHPLMQIYILNFPLAKEIHNCFKVHTLNEKRKGWCRVLISWTTKDVKQLWFSKFHSYKSPLSALPHSPPSFLSIPVCFRFIFRPPLPSPHSPFFFHHRRHHPVLPFFIHFTTTTITPFSLL